MYVVIEGVDKSGKTTLCDCLSIHFGEFGEDVLFYKIKEPSMFRKPRMWGLQGQKSRETAALWFAHDRMRNYNLISSAKNSPLLLISDRSKFSSFAYQGMDILNYNIIINKNIPDPDIIIFLKADLDEIEENLDPEDEFEDKAFLERVQQNYLGPIRQYCLRNDIKFKCFEARSDSITNEVIVYLRKELEMSL
jgi:dTMP kinase